MKANSFIKDIVYPFMKNTVNLNIASWDGIQHC